jgi:hypothetical protein
MFIVFLTLTVICLLGTVFVFVHSFYLCPYFEVNNADDPRWRVFDFNSRQAAEGDIYNVAEVPSINSVELVSPRRLRFGFTPKVRTNSWKVMAGNGTRLHYEGPLPEVQFADTAYEDTFVFIPEGINLYKPMKIVFNFGTTEERKAGGLSWGDNYYTPLSDVPFSMKQPYSIDEWAGISTYDPELFEARSIIGHHVDMNAPAMERSMQVFRFIMEKIKDATGIPSDAVQAASPLETYEFLSSGKGKGWCENNALAYYLFANAVGVKTRLVDRAGKFGLLKLTGHYFCESWIPEYAKWVYVDCMINIGNIRNMDNIPLHTVELKKLVDLNAINGCTYVRYNKETGSLVTLEAGEELYNRIKRGMTKEIVFAFKFGYPNNKSFSKVKNFLKYTTLLHAPFALPKKYLVKIFFLSGLKICFLVMLISGIGVFILKRVSG